MLIWTHDIRCEVRKKLLKRHVSEHIERYGYPPFTISLLSLFLNYNWYAILVLGVQHNNSKCTYFTM